MALQDLKTFSFVKKSKKNKAISVRDLQDNILPDLNSIQTTLAGYKSVTLKHTDWTSVTNQRSIKYSLLSSDTAIITNHITANNGAKGEIIYSENSVPFGDIIIRVTLGDFSGAVSFTIDESGDTATIDSVDKNEVMIDIADIPAGFIITGFAQKLITTFSGGTIARADFIRNIISGTDLQNQVTGNFFLANKLNKILSESIDMIFINIESSYKLTGVITTLDGGSNPVDITNLTQGEVDFWYKIEKLPTA